MRCTRSHLFLPFLATGLILLGGLLAPPLVSLSTRAQNPVKRVLVLYWYNKDFPSNARFDASFQKTLKAAAAPIEYYPEYLETDRFPASEQSTLLHDYLKKKYANVQIDVVVASGFVPQEFLIANRAELFPKTPLVFVGVEAPTTEQRLAGSGITGIVNLNSYRQTLDLALRLHPDVDQVYVVSGTIEHDKRFEKLARRELEGYRTKAQFNYLTDLSIAELISTSKFLSARSLLLFVWQQIQGTDGHILESPDVLAVLSKSATVPIYSMSGGNVGNGSVGGYVSTIEGNGKRAAELVLQILGGAAAPSLQVEAAPVVPMFDWRELRRWRISEDRLPAGSMILFKDPSFWAQYRWRIIAALALVALQSLLILGLLFERSRKKAAARSLAESEERYRNVVETQTELICRYLPDTTLTFVNDAYCRYFSKPREELIGSKYIHLVPSHAQKAAEEHIESLIADPHMDTHEHEVIRPDGSIGWHQWTNNVIAQGDQIELQGIGRDITEQKRAEEALILSEEFNRRIVESSTDCIKILDVEGNLVYMSEKGQQLLGIDDFESYKNKSWLDLWSGEEKEHARQAIALARDQKVGSFQGFALTLKGKPKWWHTVITPIQGTHGNVERLLAISRDITEEELARRAVEESEGRFAKAFQSNPQPMSLTTLIGGRYLDVNDSFLHMSGYKRDEVIGHTSKQLNIFEKPEDRNRLLVDPLLHAGVNRNFEMNFRTKSGAFRVLLSSAELLELSGEKCILVASSDITERKALEENLRLTEREFSTLVENSPDIITRLDMNLRHIYISPSLQRITGIPTELLIGKSTEEVGLEFDWQTYQTCCRDAITNRRPVQRGFEYGGRHYWTRIIPEFSPDGLVESLMTISEDVTDRIRSEQELTQLTVRLFNSQDEERRRIARELHDGTAQNLFAISVNLAKISQLSSSDTNEARELIDECQALGDQSLQEIRTLSYLLHPPLLDQAGLVSALQWYAEGFSKRSGIYVDVSAQPIDRLSPEVEMALFRVVQEALTNVRRHSHSQTVTIRLERKSSEIILDIKDRGQGFSNAKHKEDSGKLIAMGVGIPGMRQRLKQLGGKLEIVSHDNGTTISAVVPLKNGASNGKNPSRGRS